MKAFSKTSRMLVGAIALATLAVLAPVPSAAVAAGNNPHAGQKLKYVALGDSYAYGVGAANPATQSYPADLDAYRPDLVLTANLAVPGATTSDVINSQLASGRGALKNADLVTLTVGGNDLDVAGLYNACDPNPATPACQAAFTHAQSVLGGPLLSSMVTTLGAVRTAAPHAQIVVTGYPRLFDATFAANTYLAGQINVATGLLNSEVSAAASYTGAKFVDPTEAFSTHGIGCGTGCSWIHFGDADSFHPTTDGYLRGYTPLLPQG